MPSFSESEHQEIPSEPQEIPSEEIEGNEIVEPVEPAELEEEKALEEELLEEEKMLTSGDITTWAELQQAINAAGANVATISLTQDLTASKSESAIIIKANQNITLDLKGYVLNRGLISDDGKPSSNDKGSVIYVEPGGTLTIIDSNPNEPHTFEKTEDGLWILDEEGTETVYGGIITGGTGYKYYDGHYGGGVYAWGAFTMDGGNIIGNQVTHHGGGVAIFGSSEHTMKGGNIRGNVGGNGGGLFINRDNVSFTMKGGNIRDNTANNGGAVFVNRYGTTFTMDGGNISGNIAKTNGGAVYVNTETGHPGIFKMTGGTIGGENTESANKATNGGGVYVAGTIILGGSAQIIGNTDSTGDKDSNLYIPTGKNLSFESGENAPTSDMSVGVTMQTPNKAFTGECDVDYQQNFTSDNKNYDVIRSDKKLYIANAWGKLDIALSANDPQPADGLFEVSTTSDTKLITLTTDFKATAGDATLTVDGTKTLDLNGHVINGKIDGSTSVGSVINVNNGANLTLTDSSDEKNGTITGGKASYGGGVYVSGTFIMKDSTISGNTASTGGGGVFNNGTFTMNGTAQISLNSAANYGGGVYNNGTFTMNGSSQIASNSAANDGGGAHCEPGGVIWMNDYSIITNNTSLQGQGAGIYLSGDKNKDEAKLIMASNSQITRNICKSFGAGVYVGINVEFIMSENSVIASNEATNNGSGGGVYVNGTFIMDGGTISDHKEFQYGGGVFINSNGTFLMNGGKITQNTATLYGAGVFMGGNTITLGGSAQITDNIVGSSKNNLYLHKNKTVSLATGSSAPTASMSVGVTSAQDPKTKGLIAITEAYATESNPFKSDENYLFVIHDTIDNKFKLAIPVATPSATESFVYDGTNKIGVATGSGYKLTGTPSATDAGDYTATASLVAGYGWSDGTTGPKTITWSIAKAPLTEVKAANQTYTGRELTPVITAKAGNLDATFTVGSWSDALVNPGTYTATVSGTGNFTGEMQVTFTIDPRRYVPSGGTTKVTKPAGAVIGNWTYLPTTDKWTFTSNEGRTYHNEWGYVFNPYAQAGQANVSWFFFDANGLMLTGYQWIPSAAGGYRLWYLHPTSDGVLGRMYENELTPEGYWANHDGWIYINGVVQMR